jgi:resuscitation-promoting factor RpfA
MKSYSPEPLTPEERELAQLTAPLGPQGQPSTALDARILAAAHAALDRRQPPRRKPRWPVAMGLAASVIFAVGIAWQLRPLQQAPVLASAEAPMPAAAEQDAMADSVASAPGSSSLPEAAVVADQAAAASAPAHEEAAQAPPPPVKKLAQPPEQRALQVRTPTRVSEPSRRQAQVVGNVGAGVPPPPPAAPPAPVAAAAAPEPAAEPSVSFAPDPRDGYSARGTAADSAAPQAGLLAAKPQAEALAEAKASRAASSARQKESTSLDRVEVTGSRLKRTDLQVPVSDDAQLPVTEWLERVRTRYGLGDAGAAKQSLLLFVKDHPSEPVPGDLEPLLEE